MNTKETKPLCISSSNLAKMLIMVRGWTLSFFRSKVKVTIDIYGNKLVNMIDTKPLCIFLTNLTDMSTMANPIDLEVTVQRRRSGWVSSTNVGCAGMLRFALLYLILKFYTVLVTSHYMKNFLCPHYEMAGTYSVTPFRNSGFSFCAFFGRIAKKMVSGA